MGELYDIYENSIKEIHALRKENRKLKRQLTLATSQNYCKICGNTLDGYKPKEVQ